MGYPLSYGPACWLCERQILPKSPVYWIYHPLMTVAIKSGCDNKLRWYGILLSNRERPKYGPDYEYRLVTLPTAAQIHATALWDQ